MSTDKFRDVFPNPPSFVAGEQPKGLKYTRWSAQTDEGMRQLEVAVGNMFASFQINNDPYPVLLTSLTRGVGSIDYINPYIPAGIDVDNHTQQTEATDTFEMLLELFPQDTTYPNGTWMVSSTDTAIVPGQWQSNRSNLSTDGDWTHVGRRLYTYKKFDGLQTIQYHGETRDGDLGIGFAVMPNLSQLTGAINTACSVEAYIDGGGETYYVVTLPTLQKDKLLPGETSPTDPQVGVGTVTPPLPAQAQPPTGLTDNEIPPGLIRLWDAKSPVDLEAAEPISENAEYYAVSSTEFRIRGVELDEVTIPPTAPGPGVANNTRYFLVTMGVSLAEALGHLQKRFLQHDHSAESGFGAPTSHGDLSDLNFTPFDVDANPLAWVKDYNVDSIIANNDHQMYLYREGRRADDPGTYYNAMVGDLCLASSDPEGDGLHRPLIVDDPFDDSVHLTFYGEKLSVFPEIWFDRTLGRLVFRSMTVGTKPVLGGFQFGHSLDAGNNTRMQARFLGPVEIQNTLEADDAVTFNDTLDVLAQATLESLEVTNHAQFLSTLETDDLATLASLLVEGTWQTEGLGTINANVSAASGVTIDGVDISEHAHKGGVEGKQIPVEGIDRAGINGTPVRINAAGYAVYAP